MLDPSLLLAFVPDAERMESWLDAMEPWLNVWFYPGLMMIFIIASLGIPIPEDIPLILAGIVLRTHPHIATWPLTIGVSLLGIMSGDIVLYSLGRRWGPSVFAHRSVSWLITPRRFEKLKLRFRRWGMLMVFFGRFMVGVRAAMCLTAGVTRFKFWKFLLADFLGAMLSAPFFIVLGYVFAEALPTLQKFLGRFQWFAGLAVVFVILCVIWYEVRVARRNVAENAAERAALGQPPPAEPQNPQ